MLALQELMRFEGSQAAATEEFYEKAALAASAEWNAVVVALGFACPCSRQCGSQVIVFAGDSVASTTSELQ